MRDFTKPDKPSIFRPWDFKKIFNENLDLKVILKLSKDTKKDYSTGDIVPKYNSTFDILEEARKFKELQKLYLEPIKDEKFKILFEKFYLSKNVDINEASKALDAYNNAQNNYTTLMSPSGERPYFYDYMKHCRENGIDIKHGADTKMRYMDFFEGQRLDQLIDFCKNNNNELSQYMYESVYLKNKTLPPEILDTLLEINKEFGTKVFLPSNITPENIECVDFIKQELTEFKRASSDKAKYPPVIDLLKAKMEYIVPDEYGKTLAYCETNNGSVSVDGFEELKNSLRHEIAHANDNKCLSRFQLSESELKNKFWQEYRKGGISEGHIGYAFKDPREFIAVALEGDMSKYSLEFINKLKEFGMPDWCRFLRKVIR